MARSLVSPLFFLVLSLWFGACGSGAKHHRAVRPKAGRRPVTPGVLVQTEGAGDYLLTTELNRVEYLENLEPLTHALAAFYGWPDPKSGISNQSRFLQQLCHARRGQPCGTWRSAADFLQQILFSDAAALCPEVLRGVPSGAEIPPDLCSKLRRIAGQTARMVDRLAKRWPAGALPVVSSCSYDDVAAVVVEVAPGRLWVNGLDVVPLTAGEPPPDPDLPAALQSMLAAGAAVVEARSYLTDDAPAAMESRPGQRLEAREAARASETNGPEQARKAAGSSAPARKPDDKGAKITEVPRTGRRDTGGAKSSEPGRILVRARRGVPWVTVSWLLRLAASVNLSRAWLRVVDAKARPCLLPLRIWNLPLPPSGAKVRLERRGRLSLCETGHCVPVDPVGLAQRLGCHEHGCRRAWYLAVETNSLADVTTFLANLRRRVPTEPLLWILGGLSYPVRAAQGAFRSGAVPRAGARVGAATRIESRRGLVPPP